MSGLLIRATRSWAALSWRPTAATLTTPSSSRPLSYYAQKAQAKDHRRELFAQKEQRADRIQTRRADNRSQWRAAFRSWWIAKKVDEEYLERKARQAGLPWQMHVAVILERQAIVMPDVPAWERDMHDLQTHLHRYGKVYPQALTGVDAAAAADAAALTDEELLALLPEGFRPAPRVTPADASGDVRTSQRKLQTSVYLTMQETEDDTWKLPTVALQEDETLLGAAQRALEDQLGPQVEYWAPSNAPCAVDMVAFPEDQRESYYGTKTFFLKVVHDEGEVPASSSAKWQDYAWLDRQEMSDQMMQTHGDAVAKFYHYLL